MHKFNLTGEEALECLKDGFKIQASEWNDEKYWGADMGGNVYDQYNNPLTAFEVASHLIDKTLKWRVLDWF